MRTSLQQLQGALAGRVLMSSTLEATAQSLSAGKVPELWLSKSFPSLKPLGRYVKEVMERLAFFALWVECGMAPHLFWISGFFFTQVRSREMSDLASSEFKVLNKISDLGHLFG